MRYVTLEVVQQAAVLHQLSDDVDGLLHGAHSVQLDQLGMPQPLHDLSLSQEVLRVHGSCDRWYRGVYEQCFAVVGYIVLCRSLSHCV